MFFTNDTNSLINCVIVNTVMLAIKIQNVIGFKNTKLL